MSKIFWVIAILWGSLPAYAQEQPLEILTFHYPPVMGDSSISKGGLLVEMVQAAFAESGIHTTITFLPVRRAIQMVTNNPSLAYIGVKETFDPAIHNDLIEYPFFVSRFLIFYRHDRFPDKFQFQKLSDLKPYKIGVLGGGITDGFGKKNGLDIDPSPRLETVFQKLDAKRDDIGVASEFSIYLILKDLFKGHEKDFGIYFEVPFLTINSVLILNRQHPEFSYYEPKLKAGMKAMAADGQWVKIMEKYVGEGNISKESMDLFFEAVRLY